MERRKRPYSIHKRLAADHRHICYAKFRDESNALTRMPSGLRRTKAQRTREADKTQPDGKAFQV